MNDVFISYDRLDKSRIQPLIRALEKHGLSIWWDRRILPGKPFDEVIQGAIDSSKCIIVIWSKESVESGWVKEEASEGLRRKILVPILIDDIALKIPLGFKLIQAARLVDWNGAPDDPEINQLIESIRDILDRHPETDKNKSNWPIEELKLPIIGELSKPRPDTTSIRHKPIRLFLRRKSILWITFAVFIALLTFLGINYLPYIKDGPSNKNGNSNNPTGSWELSKTLEGHNDPVWSVAFLPGGKTLVSGSEDSTVRLWSVTTAKVEHVLKGDSTVNSVAVAPDGKQLASASNDKTIAIWDIETGARIKVLNGHTDQIYSVEFSPGGTILASGSKDKTIKLWDAQTGILKGTLSGHSDRVSSIAFSPNGKTLVSSGVDGKVMIWDVETRVLKATLDGKGGYVYCVAFSPDGKLVASGYKDGTVKLWNLLSRNIVQTLKGNDNDKEDKMIYTLAFSPDGKFLASAGVNSIINIWETASWDLKQPLISHTEAITSLAFSPDAKTLASASRDRTIKLWVQ